MNRVLINLGYKSESPDTHKNKKINSLKVDIERLRLQPQKNRSAILVNKIVLDNLRDTPFISDKYIKAFAKLNDKQQKEFISHLNIAREKYPELKDKSFFKAEDDVDMARLIDVMEKQKSPSHGSGVVENLLSNTKQALFHIKGELTTPISQLPHILDSDPDFQDFSQATKEVFLRECKEILDKETISETFDDFRQDLTLKRTFTNLPLRRHIKIPESYEKYEEVISRNYDQAYQQEHGSNTIFLESLNSAISKNKDLSEELLEIKSKVFEKFPQFDFIKISHRSALDDSFLSDEISKFDFLSTVYGYSDENTDDMDSHINYSIKQAYLDMREENKTSNNGMRLSVSDSVAALIDSYPQHFNSIEKRDKIINLFEAINAQINTKFSPEQDILESSESYQKIKNGFDVLNTRFDLINKRDLN